jgi:alpha-L-rhamnosidase
VRVDRRREPVGWATAGFNGSGWAPPHASAGGPGGGVGALRSARLPPVRRQPPVVPVELPPPAGSAPGSTRVLDLGRQVAGVCTWVWRGAGLAGRGVRFRYGELLARNGSVNGLTSVAGQIKSGDGGPCAPDVAYQEDAYVLRGDAGGEDFTPPCTWHAGRYVHVWGDDAATRRRWTWAPAGATRCGRTSPGWAPSPRRRACSTPSPPPRTRAT